MEHLFGILLACSSKEDELRAEALRIGGSRMTAIAQSKLLFAQQTEALLSTYDAAKCGDLFARFLANGTWQTPTLIVLWAGACRPDQLLELDPRLRYVPARIRAGWKETCAARAAAYSAEETASRGRQFAKELELVASLQRAGVGILAGSDVPNAYVLPGFGLHDELVLLVQAGLTPLEALRAATINAAQFSGRGHSHGSIEAGKTADFVLLDANPLLDIRNTQRIRAVIFDGKLFDRTALDELLRQAESESRQSRTMHGRKQDQAHRR